VKTYAVNVNTSRTPEEGAHSPSWTNELIIIIIFTVTIVIITNIIIIIKWDILLMDRHLVEWSRGGPVSPSFPAQ
jgi:hypothetical protein